MLRFYRKVSGKINFFKAGYVYILIYISAIKLGLQPKELRGVFLALEVMINK